MVLFERGVFVKFSLKKTLTNVRDGGAKEARTPDLLNAIQALYQLSYDPINKRVINLIFPALKSIEFQRYFNGKLI